MNTYERIKNGYTKRIVQVDGKFNAILVTPTGATIHNDGWCDYSTALRVVERMYRKAQ